MNMIELFTWIVAVSAITDGLLLLAVLYWPSAPAPDASSTAHRVGVRRLARALLIVGLVFGVKVVVSTFFGVHQFGWIRMAYVDLVVMIPATSAMVLLSEAVRPRDRRRCAPAMRALACVGLLGAPVGYYASCVEPYRLRLERADVDVGERAVVKAPIRVGVLADIQTNRVSDYERNAIDRLMAERPDIVLLPGDLLQCTRHEYAAQIDEMRDVVKRLDAPGGAYFVEGDVDRMDRLTPLFWATPVRVLMNEMVETRVGDQRVLIGGVELRYNSPDAVALIRRLSETPRLGRIKILMAHRPDVIYALPKDADIDLVVAGHTHGGQVVVPGFGPLITLSDTPRDVAGGGLHELNGAQIYVSRGVGMERGLSPPLRFFCPPEISLLTLTGLPDAAVSLTRQAN
ncbi:MAG TPA: metallophosphoesterase [Phycisphaerae bacterium]|nr:metallophosphoesterase [Phycisphaerae bacterium]HRW52564.1 metallophosphoesterase [Phycisphaerae bacterium]